MGPSSACLPSLLGMEDKAKQSQGPHSLQPAGFQRTGRVQASSLARIRKAGWARLPPSYRHGCADGSCDATVELSTFYPATFSKKNINFSYDTVEASVRS